MDTGYIHEIRASGRRARERRPALTEWWPSGAGGRRERDAKTIPVLWFTEADHTGRWRRQRGRDV